LISEKLKNGLNYTELFFMNKMEIVEQKMGAISGEKANKIE
jgi:hypothetical protein